MDGVLRQALPLIKRRAWLSSLWKTEIKMESLDYLQIRAYCKEAQEIADEYGVEDALSYLIGEKFSPLLSALKKAEAKVKYLYSQDDTHWDDNSLNEGDVVLRTDYSMAIAAHYQKSLETLTDLKHLRDDFVGEMKEAFEISDIKGFLESYPSLGPQTPQQAYPDDLIDSAPGEMVVEDIFSEIDDLFMVEEFKKLFQ